MVRVSTPIVVIALSLGGCARPPPEEPAPTGGQSFCDALEAWCNVDSKAALTGEDDPLERSQKREEWLSENVKNPDAIYLRTLLKVKGPTEQAATLRREAARAGLAGCPLAQTVVEQGF